MDEEQPIERYQPRGGRGLARRAPVLPAPFETVEMEEAPDLLTYWRILRKRRWTILTLFCLLFTVVLIGTLKQRPLYRAQALLEIAKENPELLSVQELFELEGVSDTYLETQYKVLRSETLARRVISQLRLAQLKEFNPEVGKAKAKEDQAAATQVFAVPGAGVADESALSQEVLERFGERLHIEPVKRSRLVAVSFESQEPARAARVVNTLAATYIERSLEARWEATQKASEWLSRELVGMKARLERSEEELQGYARAEGLLFLASAAGQAENIVNQRLRQLQEELTRAQADRYQKEARARLVEAGPNRAGEWGALPGVAENPLLEQLTVRRAELQRERAQLATTFTADYPRVKQLQNQIEELDAILAQERARLAAHLRQEYEAARRRERLLAQAFEEQQRQANQIAERSVAYNILKREVDTNQQLYEGLLQRLKEAGVSAGLKASNIRIVDAASPPEKPVKPRVALNLALAVLLGLGLGVGVAFLQEYLDNSLKSADDVERYLRLPALALIPAVESLDGERRGVSGLYDRGKRRWLEARTEADDETPALAPPAPAWYRIDGNGAEPSGRAALAEAFRSLRTSVLLSTAERPPRSLLITSSQPAEGKTTVSLNLAISLAQLGQRVLLIDADMRRPCLHKALALADSGGLASYLAGQQDWPALVQPTGVEGLAALVCGPIPPNPAELLFSQRMRSLLDEALADYPFVALDSPPLLHVADARILAALVDGVLLVVRGGSTPRELVQRAQASARDVGANLLGVVLNNLDVRADDDYYYRYTHYDYYAPRHPTAETASRGA
ncbi:MAG: polysaccharide biosynthesis tyrosine autokinase [Acidobacteria bacterium]|nr:polysaccharide biosynthesis tyrosine autokinase [Acidobacteriota bacterium]